MRQALMMVMSYIFLSLFDWLSLVLHRSPSSACLTTHISSTYNKSYLCLAINKNLKPLQLTSVLPSLSFI